ncbi:MAG TPA: phosphotransferase [Pseudonocardiaceae bacterium]
MPRYTWADLPPVVRDAVQERAGQVVAAGPAGGQTCDLAATLHLADGGRVFVKGVCGVCPRMRWLRTEITAGRLAGDLAPAVLFGLDVGKWLVVGFEHVDGRPARLGPDSADLPAVRAVMERLGRLPGAGVPDLADRWGGGEPWARLAQDHPDALDGHSRACLDELTHWERLAPGMVDGDDLLHTDLHGDQFLITPEGRVYVIDWARPARGAAWVDLVMLVIRLVGAGHGPRDAEAWAGRLPAWQAASPEQITAVACYLAGLWLYRAVTEGGPGALWRASVARRYAAYRLARVPVLTL